MNEILKLFVHSIYTVQHATENWRMHMVVFQILITFYFSRIVIVTDDKNTTSIISLYNNESQISDIKLSTSDMSVSGYYKSTSLQLHSRTKTALYLRLRSIAVVGCRACKEMQMTKSVF